MTTQPEALRLAEHLDAVDEHVLKSGTLKPCAALLRTQHEAIERKDALLRQALERLRASTPDACPMDDDYAEQGWSRHSKTIAAITKELQ